MNIYLSGEIHTDWRAEIMAGLEGLDIKFTSAVTDHNASDAAGDILGPHPNEGENGFWQDHKSAKVNAIRTKNLIEMADLVVVRFGDQYKQWNAAFDAGYCAALNKPYITLHDENIIHPLKEVDAQAMAWTTTTTEVISLIQYTLRSS